MTLPVAGVGLDGNPTNWEAHRTRDPMAKEHQEQVVRGDLAVEEEEQVGSLVLEPGEEAQERSQEHRDKRHPVQAPVHCRRTWV